MIDFFWLICIAAIIRANILGFRIKKILKKNGFEVHGFSGHFNDIKNIFSLAKVTKDKISRRRYFLLGLNDFITIPIVLICFFKIISSTPSFNDNACKALANFKNQEYKVVVIDKFLDKNQHSYPTLILQDQNGNKITNQDFIFDKSGFFNYVQKGDTLIKSKNNTVINLINMKVDTLIRIEYKCEVK